MSTKAGQGPTAAGRTSFGPLAVLLTCLHLSACAPTPHAASKPSPVLRRIGDADASATRASIEESMRIMLTDAADDDLHHRGLAATFIDGTADYFATVGVRAHGNDNEGAGTIDRSTVFPIGSISKTFAGVLLAGALRRGEVADLHDPIGRVWRDKLPIPRGATREMSWEDLATHRAGLPFFPTNWTPGEEVHRAGYTTDAFRSYLGTAKLESEPGTTVRYGNTSYALLAMSLAEVAGKSYPDLLQERIFRPLGMAESEYPDRDEAPPASYVEGWGTSCQPQPWRSDPTPMGPCCVIRSSMTDLTRFARALMTPGSAWSDDFETMTRPRAETPWGLDESFGLGLTVKPARGLAWKDGQVEGVRSFLLLEASKGRALILLASSYRVDVTDLAFRLWDLLTGDPSGPLTRSERVSTTPVAAQRVDAQLTDDVVVEAVEAPLVAAPGQNVTVSVYLRCTKQSPRPYRFYSDLWMGRAVGRIVRTQRLSHGAACEADGTLLRHDANYTIPHSPSTYRADLWVGLTGLDHANDRPNAASDGTQRKRIASIVVVDPAKRPLATWGK